MKTSTRNAFKSIPKLFIKKYASATSSSHEAIHRSFESYQRSIEQFINAQQQSLSQGSGSATRNASKKDQENLGQIIARSLGGSSFFDKAFQLYSKSIVLDFSYIKEPSFKAMQSSIGGYYGVLADMAIEQERLSQEITMMRVQSERMLVLSHFTPIVLKLLLSKRADALRIFFNSSLTGSILRLGGKQFVRRLERQMRTFYRRIARRMLGAGATRLAVRKLASIFSKATGLIGFAAELVIAVFSVRKYYADQEKKVLQQNLHETRAVTRLFDPSQILPLYRTSLPLLLDSNAQNFSEILSTTDPNSLVSKTYASSRFDLESFGIATEDVLNLSSSISRTSSIKYSEIPDASAFILEYSGIFMGGNTSTMSNIMQNLIISEAGSSQDITKAKNAFEYFFTAIVGDGEPQGAQLNLIEALAEFSADYGAAERLSVAPAQEIAKVYNFMTGNKETLNGRFTPDVTIEAVSTVDDLLLEGLLGENMAARSIFTHSGLSNVQAAKGVTSDATIFREFLYGALEYMQIGLDEIPDPEAEEIPRGSEYEQALMNLQYNLKLDTINTQVLDRAFRMLAENPTMQTVELETVMRELNGQNRSIPVLLEKAVEFVTGEASTIFDIMKSITFSSNQLTTMMNVFIRQIQAMQSVIATISLEKNSIYAESVLRLSQALLSGMYGAVPERRPFRENVTGYAAEAGVNLPELSSSQTANAANRLVQQPIQTPEGGLTYPTGFRTVDDFFTFYSDADLPEYQNFGILASNIYNSRYGQTFGFGNQQFNLSNDIERRQFLSTLNMLVSEVPPEYREGLGIPVTLEDREKWHTDSIIGRYLSGLIDQRNTLQSTIDDLGVLDLQNIPENHPLYDVLMSVPWVPGYAIGFYGLDETRIELRRRLLREYQSQFDLVETAIRHINSGSFIDNDRFFSAAFDQRLDTDPNDDFTIPTEDDLRNRYMERPEAEALPGAAFSPSMPQERRGEPIRVGTTEQIITEIFKTSAGDHNILITTIASSEQRNYGPGYDYVILTGDTYNKTQGLVNPPSNLGAPIYFPFAKGEVIFAGVRGSSNSADAYGNSVVIRLLGENDEPGPLVSFSHLELITVSVGQKLLLGDKMGTQGATGRGTGVHVDFEVFNKPGLNDDIFISGSRMNPALRINDPDTIVNTILPYARKYETGGFVPPTTNNKRGYNTPLVKNRPKKHVTIKIPIATSNPSAFVAEFMSLMQSKV